MTGSTPRQAESVVTDETRLRQLAEAGVVERHKEWGSPLWYYRLVSGLGGAG